jgi:hypothetical protein
MGWERGSINSWCNRRMVLSSGFIIRIFIINFQPISRLDSRSWFSTTTTTTTKKGGGGHKMFFIFYYYVSYLYFLSFSTTRSKWYSVFRVNKQLHDERCKCTCINIITYQDLTTQSSCSSKHLLCSLLSLRVFSK